MRRLLYILPFLFVASVWGSYSHWLPTIRSWLDSGADLNGLGAFGDAFGALNALFSALAFAAIILSIYLQSNELQASREDLSEQRQQQKKQVFESSFFQLLRLSSEIVRDFKYVSDYDKNNNSVGKSCFEAIRKDFVSVGLMSSHWGSDVEARYEKFYLLHTHDELGHYFRNLYQVVKLVHFSNIDDKKFYTNIIRAQLSSHELFLLFYNGLSRFGRERFFPLLIDYEFFEHLPVDEEVLQTAAETYGIKAFGTSPEWKAQVRLKYYLNISFKRSANSGAQHSVCGVFTTFFLADSRLTNSGASHFVKLNSASSSKTSRRSLDPERARQLSA